MADDIVTRLRKEWEYGNNAKGCDYEMFAQAADEIERLRQENADILATIPIIIKGVQNGMAEEIEKLRSEIEDWKQKGGNYE